MGRHPWEITLREFVEIARRDYGIEVELVSAAIAVGWILRKGESVVYPVPVADPDKIMPPHALWELCILHGIPPIDLHLDPSGE